MLRYAPIGLLVVVAACSQPQTTETEATANEPVANEPAGSVAGAPMPVTLAEVTEPVELSEGTIESFIDAANELSELGDDVTVSDSGATGFMEGVQINAEALAVLDKHGFEPAEFQQVGYSIGMAMAAESMEENRAEMEEAQRKLEEMKGKVPEAQYELLKSQMMGASEMFSGQPDGNVELVAEYREQIEAIGDSR